MRGQRLLHTLMKQECFICKLLSSDDLQPAVYRKLGKKASKFMGGAEELLSGSLSILYFVNQVGPRFVADLKSYPYNVAFILSVFRS